MFSVVGTHNYFSTKEQLLSQVERQLEMVKVRTTTVIHALIWNYANDSIKDFSSAELQSEFIGGIIITDGTENIYSALKDELGYIEQSNLTEYKKSELALEFKLLYRENGEESYIGHVYIRKNQNYVDKILRDVLQQQLLQSFGYCFVLFALIWLLVNHLVITPLEKLNEHLLRITNYITLQPK